MLIEQQQKTVAFQHPLDSIIECRSSVYNPSKYKPVIAKINHTHAEKMTTFPENCEHRKILTNVAVKKEEDLMKSSFQILSNLPFWLKLFRLFPLFCNWSPATCTLPPSSLVVVQVRLSQRVEFNDMAVGALEMILKCVCSWMPLFSPILGAWMVARPLQRQFSLMFQKISMENASCPQCIHVDGPDGSTLPCSCRCFTFS